MIILDTRGVAAGEYSPTSAPFTVGCQAIWVIVEDCDDDTGATATLEVLQADQYWKEVETISGRYQIDRAGTYRIAAIAPCRCVIVSLEDVAGPCIEMSGPDGCDCFDEAPLDGQEYNRKEQKAR